MKSVRACAGLTKLRSLRMDNCKALHPKGSDHFRFLAGMPGLTELSWRAHSGKPDWIEPDASMAGAENRRHVPAHACPQAESPPEVHFPSFFSSLHQTHSLNRAGGSACKDTRKMQNASPSSNRTWSCEASRKKACLLCLYADAGCIAAGWTWRGTVCARWTSQ